MSALVVIHSIIRWFVLAGVLATIVVGFTSARAGRPWQGNDGLYRITAVVIDIQVAIGIILWLGTQAWSTENAFIAYIHPVAMLGALGVFHAFVGKGRKAGEPSAHRSMAIGAIIALVLMVLGIPWSR